MPFFGFLTLLPMFGAIGGLSPLGAMLCGAYWGATVFCLGLLRRQYRRRNHVERFVNRIKHFHRVATRNEKTARNFMGFVQLAALFCWIN